MLLLLLALLRHTVRALLLSAPAVALILGLRLAYVRRRPAAAGAA